MPLDLANDHDDDNKPQRKVNTGPAMSERELLAILRAEEVDATSYYTSELAKDQAEAMDRYYAKLYGDEVPDRSKVTTHDIENTINWMMPDIMRVFWQSDNLVSVSSENPQYEDQADTVADCLSYVFFTDNKGREVLHDFVFDGLLQRMGVASVRWQDPEPEPEEELEGVTPQQLMQIMSDPEYTILEQTSSEPDEDDAKPQVQGQQPGQQMGQPPALPTFTLKVQRKRKFGKAKIEVVPPEEFAISRRARSIEHSAYHRREQELYLADIVRMFPDSAASLDPEMMSATNKDIEINSDPRTLSRFQQEAVTNARETSNYSKRKKVQLYTEYIRIDWDNDGVVELRQIKRVNDVILENERVDASEFVAWSPIRISHKLVGRSVADTVMDIQRIRTVVTRRMLDSLNQSLLPRIGYDKSKMDPEDIDALVDAEVGGIIGTNGNPNDVLQPITTPDLTASGFQMLQYWDQQEERASGVSNDAHTMAPNAKTETASGLDQLMESANDRIELVVRWAANGLEEILTKCLKLLVAHQDAPRMIKIKGQPVEMDPRTWHDEVAVSVHVAMAASNRKAMIGMLGGIAAKQEQAIQMGGPDNPVCDVTHLIHTYGKLTETMGFRDVTKFWKTPEQAQQMLQQQAQQPKQDPKMMEMQQRGQIEGQKLQLQAQAQQHDMQLKQSAAQQDVALKSQAANAKAAADEKIAAQKVLAETRIAAEKLAAETAIAEKKLASEIQLAQQKMAFEQQMAREQMAHDRELSKQKAVHDHEFRMHSLTMKGTDLREQSGIKMSTGSGDFGGKVG